MPTTFPQAGMIPGQFFGQAPMWWAPMDPANVTDLDDPRWIGSVNHSHDNGVGLEAAFRGLQHTDGGQLYLFMSFRVYTDPNADGQPDLVWLGLQRQAGAPAYIVEINSPAAVTDHDAASTGGVAWSTVPETGGQRTAVGGAVPQLEDRAWMKTPSGGSNVYKWALQLRIPVRNGGADLDANGINLGNLLGGDSFRFWYTIIVDHGKVVSNNPLTYAAVKYAFPRTGADLSGLNANPVFPATTNWDTASLTAAPSTGISLSGWNITANGGTNAIKASPNHSETNSFFIRWTNNGINPNVPAGAIKAIARIANWGSQTPIDKAPAGFTTFQQIPFTGTPPNPPVTTPGIEPTNSADVAPGGQSDNNFNWIIDATTAGYWVPPNTATLAIHQCVMAEIQQVGGGVGFDFINDSAYNNMNFQQTASPVRQSAEINVKGREHPGGGTGKHKVYVFVERTSAPAVIEGGQQAPPPPEIRTMAFDQPNLAAVGERAGGIDFDTIAAQVPTIRYHTYHPTGVKIHTRPKRLVELYDAQTAFGTFVFHEGVLYGWEHELVSGSAAVGEAEPARPQKLGKGDDAYVIDVPHDGAVVVDTVITPLEEPPKPKPVDQDPWWVKLIKAIIAWFRKLLGQ